MWKCPEDQVTASPACRTRIALACASPLSARQAVPGPAALRRGKAAALPRRREDTWRWLGPPLLRDRARCYGARVQLGFWVAPKVNKVGR